MAGWNWENLPRCTPAPALSNLCSGKHVSEEIYSAKSIWSGSCLFVNVLAVPHHPCSRRPLRCMCTQGGASGTRDEGAWAPRSRFRQKLHPSSQAWPLLSASNRGETAIAKCPNWKWIDWIDQFRSVQAFNSNSIPIPNLSIQFQFNSCWIELNWLPIPIQFMNWSEPWKSS